MKFIDPRIDFAFKKIFGSEEAKDILISFLESLLGLEGERRIAELTLLDPFLAPRIQDLKSSVLDVKCRDHRGVSYIVEMQIQKAAAFLKRIQYNAAKTYVHQIARGDEYPRLNQVIAITITDFLLFNGFEHCVSRHESRETITGQVFLQDILYCFIELPKFTKPLAEVRDVLDQWISFIKYAGDLEAIPETIQVEPIRHAFERARVATLSTDELELYDKAGIALTDTQGALQLAREEGEQAGREKGRQEGRQEGEHIGREKGRQEGAGTLLRRYLHRKFGAPLDAAVESKLSSASLDEIEKWMDRIGEAQSLDDVFMI